MRVSSTLGGQFAPNLGSLFFRDENASFSLPPLSSKEPPRISRRRIKKINAHKNGRHLSRQKIFFFCFRRTNAESKVASERELFSCQIKFPTFKMEYYFLLTLQSSFYMSSGRDSVSAESALWPLTEGRSGASFSDSDSDPEFSLSVETVEYMIPVSGSTALSSTSV